MFPELCWRKDYVPHAFCAPDLTVQGTVSTETLVPIYLSIH